jgi:hypothetical protein
MSVNMLLAATAIMNEQYKEQLEEMYLELEAIDEEYSNHSHHMSRDEYEDHCNKVRSVLEDIARLEGK